MTGSAVRERVVATCVKLGVPDLAARITIQWNRRFTARMGDAKWFRAKNFGIIRLSVPLWPHASDTEREETIVHEICHLIAEFRYGGRQGHGANWRALMQQCGYPDAQRCHTVNHDQIVQRRRQRRRIYRMQCGCIEGVVMGRIQFQRLRAGTVYRCLRCRERIQPRAK